jgi:large subunit ribosomal protein L5
MQRLQKAYREEIRPALMEEFGYRNIMEVPRLQKIVVNVGVGEALDNAKALDHAGRHDDHRAAARGHSGA